MMTTGWRWLMPVVAVLLSAYSAEAATFTLRIVDLDNNPIVGVEIRVRVFDVADRNNPRLVKEQIVKNTGKEILTIDDITEVQLVVDDKGLGQLKTATLTGLINVTQSLIVVMPAENIPPYIICECPRQRCCLKIFGRRR
ncbi:hypothetical protein [Frigoriglobus tundricola]|uniref:hypothetical protein n=1 Tax=Frigoriglobus tundricola TaxID=2774151 RepID=UPI00148EAF66|nr:hypothetical protein [Frigoriglobus tundricola]